MANETMTVNRLPALTWNWLKMNAARLEANAPAVGAAPSLRMSELPLYRSTEQMSKVEQLFFS